jgi:hypothetical protein
MKRNLTLLASVAMLAAAFAVKFAAASPAPGFAPGTWVGTGVQKGLFSVVPGDLSPVDGTATFTLNVSNSLRATGSLALKTRMQIDHAGMRGVVTGTTTATLSGSGSDVRFSGPMRLAGKLTDGNITVPFAITKPVRGRLLITRAGCTSVVGKTDSQLAFKWTAAPKPGTPRFRCP